MLARNQTLKLISYCLILTNSFFAQGISPKFPFIQNNVCPFEGCRYGKWTAESPLIAYTTEGDSSKIAFKIAKNEQFTAIRGNVHTIKPGKLLITETSKKFKKGCIVYVLSYQGEGSYYLLHKGKIYNYYDFDAPCEFISKPIFVWWVLIQNKAGKCGWLMLKNITEDGFKTKERINGSDALS